MHLVATLGDLAKGGKDGCHLAKRNQRIIPRHDDLSRWTRADGSLGVVGVRLDVLRRWPEARLGKVVVGVDITQTTSRLGQPRIRWGGVIVLTSFISHESLHHR